MKITGFLIGGMTQARINQKRCRVQLFSQIAGSLNTDDVITLASDHEDRAKDPMDFFQRVMIKTSLSLREKPVEGLGFPPSAEQRKEPAVFFEIGVGVRLFSRIRHQTRIIRLF